jgi:prophage regulatory protein
MAKRVLDRKTLRDEKGVLYSNVHLLRKEAEGTFPKRIRLGENRIGWLEDEIDAWIDARAADRSRVAPKPKLTKRRRRIDPAKPGTQASVIESVSAGGDDAAAA